MAKNAGHRSPAIPRAPEMPVQAKGAMGTRRSFEGFEVFAPPESEPLRLETGPRLESWDARGHPSQVALGRYLDYLERLAAPMLASGQTALALELGVGLPQEIELTVAGGDLDNYLYPVIRRLGWDRFVSAYALKRRGMSTVRVSRATRCSVGALAEWNFCRILTNVSTDVRAWKEQVAEQVATQATTEPEDALELQISFRVARRRNWASLWKPAIDSLGSILGNDPAGRPFHPRDDRIVLLGVHRTIDDSMGNRVGLGVWWRPATRHRDGM
jgi:hypothetical protein